MPPYAVHCAACAANKSLLSVSRHKTGCSCHCRFFTLLARPKLLNNIDLLGNTDTIFLHDRPSPLLFLTSLSVLPVLLVGITVSKLSLFDSAMVAESFSFSLILGCFFILSGIHSQPSVEWTAPWQYWCLKISICLSCMLAVFSSFFSVPPGDCYAGKGIREADGLKKRVRKCGRKTNMWWRDGTTRHHTYLTIKN